MYKEFFVKRNEVSLYCRRYGTGEETILMIHGACVDCDFWGEAAQMLSGSFTVITYDRRGYGRSSESADNMYSVQEQAADAAAIIRRVGRPCYIVAHSGGTTIAMELASLHPYLVQRMLLHEPAAVDCVPENAEFCKNLELIRKMIADERYTQALAKFLPFIGEKDERAREMTDIEQRHMGKNLRHFIRNEFLDFFSYCANRSSLQNTSVSIGVGELSRGTPRWEMAVGLGDKLQAKMVYFPGSHNCAFDLPREFSYLVEGALQEK